MFMFPLKNLPRKGLTSGVSVDDVEPLRDGTYVDWLLNQYETHMCAIWRIMYMYFLIGSGDYTNLL